MSTSDLFLSLSPNFIKFITNNNFNNRSCLIITPYSFTDPYPDPFVTFLPVTFHEDLTDLHQYRPLLTLSLLYPAQLSTY